MPDKNKVKVRVKSNSSDPIHVPYLGSFEPGKWTEVDKIALEQYEANYGKISDKFDDETLVEVEGVKNKPRPKEEVQPEEENE